MSYLKTNDMNAKQKIVADRILSRLKRAYNGYYGYFMQKATTASGLIEVCETSIDEQIIDCAEGVYAPSTIYRMKSENDGDTTYNIWCAIEDYIWNEWKNEKVTIKNVAKGLAA